MRDPLQQSSGTPYERPNQRWLCGQAGGPCPMGPDSRGSCPEAAACHPVRDGDRWRCNRSAPRGGDCEEGPTPEGQCCQVYRCKPFRSLRSRRARFVLACTVATIGALCLMLSAEWRSEAIAPGELSVHHAQLIQRGDETKRCANCHVAGNQTLGQWLGHATDPALAQPHQTELCLECHRTQIAPEMARLAHNVPREELMEIGGNDASGGRRREPGEAIACAACHREHHGLRHELALMSDTACQACHRQQYNSLATDHPEFAQWPWRRRTRIAFDHAAHQAKHHPKEKQAFRCTDCHTADAGGAFQLTLDYDTTCASCHESKISASLAAGVPLLSLPTLDADALRAAGHDLGEWPEAATGDFDGALPLVMQLLLVADSQTAMAMAQLGPDFDFFDLDLDDAESLKATAQVAAGIKRLLREVVERGHGAVRLRVETLLEREVSAGELEALLARLSPDTLTTISKRWLPNKQQEPSEDSPAGIASAEFVTEGGWYRDEQAMAIRYRPTGHADSWVTAWLNVAAEASTGPQAALIDPLLKRWTAPTAMGLCGSCHSVDRAADGRRSIQWKPLDPFAERDISQQLTHFSHRPHLLQPPLADCTACHELDPAAEVMASYPGDDPRVFVSGFLPIRKQDCAECHTSRAAGDSCQQCHRYHTSARP